jgi:hypothetical protein
LLGLLLVLARLTVAIEPLAITPRTTLNVTPLNVELAFDDTAIMTWAAICAPIVGLVAVTYAGNVLCIDGAGQDLLSFANLRRPVLGHRDAAKDDLRKFVGHCGLRNEA